MVCPQIGGVRDSEDVADRFSFFLFNCSPIGHLDPNSAHAPPPPTPPTTANRASCHRLSAAIWHHAAEASVSQMMQTVDSSQGFCTLRSTNAPLTIQKKEKEKKSHNWIVQRSLLTLDCFNLRICVMIVVVKYNEIQPKYVGGEGVPAFILHHQPHDDEQKISAMSCCLCLALPFQIHFYYHYCYYCSFILSITNKH